jgi:uncharacterized protein YlxW (UPF0749 family)
MIVLIVAMVMAASVIRSIFGVRHRRDRDSGREALMPAQESAETQRLRDEVKQLKDRLAVIERITVEKENSLEREIERLRDR